MSSPLASWLPWDPWLTPLPKDAKYSMERGFRIAKYISGSEYDRLPPVVIKRFSTEDVGSPLLGILRVLPPVVFDDGS